MSCCTPYAWAPRDWPEYRDPHIVVMLELHLDRHADPHVLDRAVHDLRGQPGLRVLFEFNDGDHVRRRERLTEPRVLVDRVGGDGRPSGDRHRGDVPAVAAEAHPHRRVEVALAGLAAVDPQLALGAAGPEGRGFRGHCGQHPGGGSGCHLFCSPSASSARLASTAAASVIRATAGSSPPIMNSWDVAEVPATQSAGIRT